MLGLCSVGFFWVVMFGVHFFFSVRPPMTTTIPVVLTGSPKRDMRLWPNVSTKARVFWKVKLSSWFYKQNSCLTLKMGFLGKKKKLKWNRNSSFHSTNFCLI